MQIYGALKLSRERHHATLHGLTPNQVPDAILSDPLTAYIEKEIQDAHADKVMAEFMALTTKQIVARDNDLDSDPVV